MSKGEQTKAMIVARAAGVFNQQGFAGARLDDIKRATGLEKGGIYNHFGSKDELALQAFDYAVGLMQARFGEAIHRSRHAAERLSALVGVFEATILDPALPGGCPLLNTSVEADDTHPELRARARAAMDELFGLIERIVARGIERHELRPDTDAATVATLLIATLEGGIMLSKLYNDPRHIQRAGQYLRGLIESDFRA